MPMAHEATTIAANFFISDFSFFLPIGTGMPWRGFKPMQWRGGSDTRDTRARFWVQNPRHFCYPRRMRMIQEFKEFAMKGNVIDLAVGIIIGGAFGKIVSSMVNELLMPVIGLVMGKISFANLFFALDGKTYPSLDAAKAAGAAVIPYGLFINSIIDFVIVAFCLFLIIKAINRFKRKEELAPSAPVEPPADVRLLTEIRDLLKR